MFKITVLVHSQYTLWIWVPSYDLLQWKVIWLLCTHHCVKALTVRMHNGMTSRISWRVVKPCLRSRYTGCCQNPRWSSSPQKSLYSRYLARLLPACGAALPVRKSGGCCTTHGPHRQCGQGGCCCEPFIWGWSPNGYPVVHNCIFIVNNRLCQNVNRYLACVYQLQV